MAKENSKFNPEKYMTNIKGKSYLEVKFRLHWFRLEKADWDIKTELIHFHRASSIVDTFAVVKADIYDEKGNHRSSGQKMETQKGFPDFLEKAETGAIGRALAALGYGTLQCFDLDEGIEECRIADSPVNPKSYSGGQAQPPKQNPGNGYTGGKPAGGSGKATEKQLKKIFAICNNLQLSKEDILSICSNSAKRKIESSKDLTIAEASKVIEFLIEQEKAGFQAPTYDNEALIDEFSSQSGFIALIPPPG